MRRFTLVTDGPSDVVLVPILSWLLGQRTTEPFELQWAELRTLPEPPKGLRDRIHAALELYPCELLFTPRGSLASDVHERSARRSPAWPRRRASA